VKEQLNEHAEIAALRARIAELESEAGASSGEVRENLRATAAQLEEAQQRVAHLEAQEEEMKRRLVSLGEEARSAQDKYERELLLHKQNIEQLKEEVCARAKEVSQSKELLEVASKENATLLSQWESVKEQLNEQRRRGEEFKMIIETSEKRMVESSQALADYTSKADVRIKTLEEEKAALEMKAGSAHAEIAVLRARIAELESEAQQRVARLEAQEEEMKRKLVSLGEEARSAQDKYERELLLHKQNIEQLKLKEEVSQQLVDVSGSGRHLLDTSGSRLDTSLDASLRSVNEDEANNEQLMSIIKYLRREKEIMAGRLEVAETEIVRVGQQLAHAQKAAAETER
jgi:nucleoprotein TPR